MPLGAFTPSQIPIDYPEWQSPVIGDIGKVWAYTGSGYAPTSLNFDPAGTAAAAVAAHVGLPNPHSQYYLASGVSGFGATLASAADAAAARTTLELGTAAVLNVGTGANNIVQLDGSARLPAVDGSQLTGVTVAAAGSNTQVVYNASGVYAGHSGMTYSSTNSRLTVAGGLVAPSMRPASDSTTALQLQNAAGIAVVTVDTTNRYVGINKTPAQLFQVATLLSTVGGKVTQDILSVYENGGANFGSTIFITSRDQSKSSLIAWRIGDASSNGAQLSLGNTSTQDQNFYIIIRQGTNSNALRIDTSADTHVNNLTVGSSLFSGDGTAFLDIAASTTTRASLRIRAGTAPTTPNAGDIWYATGDRLKLYRAATETIASGVPGTGGSATAGGTWGATEQSMLQKCYDIVRAFGMLS